MHPSSLSSSFFFFNDTATTEIYTLSLHDALPISEIPVSQVIIAHRGPDGEMRFFSTIARDIRERKAYEARLQYLDRKSTRLNSSHLVISYAVFCLKKKIKNNLTANHTSNRQNTCL